METSYERILAEYRTADLNRRLHMYLDMPRLRAEFIEIDRSDRPLRLPGDASNGACTLSAWLGDLFGKLGMKRGRLSRSRQAEDFLRG